MDEKEKARFKQILSKEFNDNLKYLNDALDKHIQSITYKKHFNKIMYEKNKENDKERKAIGKANKKINMYNSSLPSGEFFFDTT